MPKAKCPQCGNVVTYQAGYDPICPACGFRGAAPTVAPGFSAPPSGPTATLGSAQAPASGNGMAIASLVCGIAGFVVGITAPIALVLGIVALNQKPDSTGRAMAITGIVLGALVTIGLLLFFLFITAIVGGW